MNQSQSPDGGISIESEVLGETITLPTVTFASESGDAAPVAPAHSDLAASSSISAAELVELSTGEGSMIYYPSAVEVAIGDVFYLRERERGENGVIVQVINKETASYPQVESKVLWRLLTAVRGQQLQRVHHEPAEVIDQFLVARFKVRASIVNGTWKGSEGRVVTRNVDIFPIAPKVLTDNILTFNDHINLDLGNFKTEPVSFSGEGFDKINLITGMKGTGKSHITKGIIDESRRKGMTAVIFDINDEYSSLPDAVTFRPRSNLKFRMDRVSAKSVIDIIERLAPFAERTGVSARAEIPRLIEERVLMGRCPDVDFLKKQVDVVFPGKDKFLESMRASYLQSLTIIDRYGLFTTEAEAAAEDEQIKKQDTTTSATLSSAFYELYRGNRAGVLVFSIGGMLPSVQMSIVSLVLDSLETLCRKQYAASVKNVSMIPIYPTVYFEEAHMYMDARDINEIIPVIRHLGMNLFFVTNTPCDLPDSVFRLLDNLLMTRLLNDRDISQVAMCGLTDKGTLEKFASQLPDHHALLVSGKDRSTKGFPLVFEVRDFGLPTSGVTKSMWRHLGKMQETISPSQDS